MAKGPLIGIVMGSDSDWPVLEAAHKTLNDFGVAHEVRVISAHRTPNEMLSYAAQAKERGLKIIIAGAGGAAHLPGMIASVTILPVIGVPVNITKLEGVDSFLSIVQMPKGVPVATVAIDNSTNAALLAIRILATLDSNLGTSLTKKLGAFKMASKEKVKAADKKMKIKKPKKKK
jgi:5-(carboxyamino)imidazole ribonucleotide mutase